MQLNGTVRTHDIVITVQVIRDMFNVGASYHLHDLENQLTKYRCIDTRGGNPGVSMTEVYFIVFREGMRAYDSFSELMPLAKAFT